MLAELFWCGVDSSFDSEKKGTGKRVRQRDRMWKRENKNSCLQHVSAKVCPKMFQRSIIKSNTVFCSSVQPITLIWRRNKKALSHSQILYTGYYRLAGIHFLQIHTFYFTWLKISNLVFSPILLNQIYCIELGGIHNSAGYIQYLWVVCMAESELQLRHHSQLPLGASTSCQAAVAWPPVCVCHCPLSSSETAAVLLAHTTPKTKDTM